ncbi:T9SS type A sorting domain-containing protein [Adhaeribacter sp. BT258]|uniref:T9SS type A sorting domain-containing protein n=1 Tax=Adhaeribacter terrigena TaxID=2793070 RepID=A0ABS1C141_9BACT|nr:T9SS type A sorting domain-containing protein [Adhaeribacter terrigena]MBK0403043.1 T9SS type A sorting domain-containing protein [Adhaeribacter terrigena]
MRKLIYILVLAVFFGQSARAQFSTVTKLNSVGISSDTKEKPQSKVWMHAGKYWTVLANFDGTHVWRLDGTTWTNVLKISPSEFGRADCKVAGNIVHIFLFRKTTSYLISVEYEPETSTYKLWSDQTSRVPVIIDTTAETATIDIDTNHRMWLASDNDSAIISMWSDPPYANWSKPVVIMSKVLPDDIGAVIALPMLKKVGIFWSNQRTKRFGFKLHADNAPPENWSADEVPAVQSAINFGSGMADDHMNLSVGRDGTLYCAVKTSYDRPGYPRLALLIRRPSGTWDNLYEVSEIGTRPIVLLNEDIGKIRIVYSAAEAGGDILYKESYTSKIKFSPTFTLLSGKYNHCSSIKNGNYSESVILFSDLLKAFGVIVTDEKKETPELAISPNPMHSGSSTIVFTVPAKSEYSITLYNLGGKLVRILEGYSIVEEKHAIDLEASQIPLGLYILRLQTDKGSKSLKIIRN